MMLRAVIFVALFLGTAYAQSVPAPSISPAANVSLPELDATEVVDLLCSKQITARQYLEALFDRLYGEGYSCLAAFQYVNVSQALQQADAIDARAAAGEDVGPLCGLPLAVKDSTDVAGLPTSAGTTAMIGFMPATSAPLIDQYIGANGVIMGKTALHELSAGGTTIGPTSNNLTSTLNPWNVRYHCGGSSGGAGCSLAARLTPLATCEDTGGSCRIPASATGTVGLRPTLDCYNQSDGLVPASFTRDTVGSMARNMGDLILLDSILRNPGHTSRGHGALPTPGVSCAAPVDNSFSLAGTRIGMPVEYWENGEYGVDPAIMDVFDNAMVAMEEAGVELVPINMTEVFDMPGNQFQIAYFEEAREFARYLYTHALNNSEQYGNVSPYTVFSQINSPVVYNSTFTILQNGITTQKGDPDAWVQYLGTDRPAYIAAWAATYQQYNVTAMFYPVINVELRPIDLSEPNCIGPRGDLIACGNTFLTGDDAKAAQTVLTLPLGLSRGGLPVGANFAGPLGTDGTLLSMGLALEEVLGRMPAPASPPGCIGCSAVISNQTVTYGGEGPVGPEDVWSAYNLRFEGACLDSSLASYGTGGMSGMGPIAAAG